jgi:predicted RNase H-like nuclease (RuvC/YqgF family)
MNIKEFLRSWNPWHLRRRIGELEQKAVEYGESLERLTECRDNLVAECNRHNVKEIERLEKEVRRLQGKTSDMLCQFQRLGQIISSLHKNFSRDKKETNNEPK